MKRGRRWIVVAPLIAVLLLPACREATSSGESGADEPYTLDPIEGTDMARVVLTERAAERVGIETAAVARVAGQITVAASAIWIDVDGAEWVYTNPELLVFVREAVSVKRYEGDVAVLADGPTTGTEVVTVGVAQLIGSEFGV